MAVGDHGDDAYRVERRQPIHQADHVADQRRDRRDGIAAGLDHTQADCALAGRLPVPDDLEEDEVAQEDDVYNEDANGRGRIGDRAPQVQPGEEGHDHQRGQHDGQDKGIDQSSQEARAHTGHVVADAHAFRRLEGIDVAHTCGRARAADGLCYSRRINAPSGV